MMMAVRGVSVIYKETLGQEPLCNLCREMCLFLLQLIVITIKCSLDPSRLSLSLPLKVFVSSGVVSNCSAFASY